MKAASRQAALYSAVGNSDERCFAVASLKPFLVLDVLRCFEEIAAAPAPLSAPAAVVIVVVVISKGASDFPSICDGFGSPASPYVRVGIERAYDDVT